VARISWLVLGVAGGEAPDEAPETNAPADARVPTLDTGAVRDGTADVDPDPVADADPKRRVRTKCILQHGLEEGSRGRFGRISSLAGAKAIQPLPRAVLIAGSLTYPTP